MNASELPAPPAALGVQDRSSRSRDIVLVRNYAYNVSSAERALLPDVGKFRTVAVSDLLRYRYDHDPAKLRQDLVNLRRRNWSGRVESCAARARKTLLLVLTKEGRRLVQQQGDHPNQQQFYVDFVKTQEVATMPPSSDVSS